MGKGKVQHLQGCYFLFYFIRFTITSQSNLIFYLLTNEIKMVKD